jgi:hypothetical protein
MSAVRVTVSVGTRAISIDELADARLASALRSAGQEVARRLQIIACPVHGKTAANVRVHFDQRGGADLQYDSCCEQLGESIGKAMA